MIEITDRADRRPCDIGHWTLRGTMLTGSSAQKKMIMRHYNIVALFLINSHFVNQSKR